MKKTIEGTTTTTLSQHINLKNLAEEQDKLKENNSRTVVSQLMLKKSKENNNTL